MLRVNLRRVRLGAIPTLSGVRATPCVAPLRPDLGDAGRRPYLVEWFNQVDLTYRTDMQTLNDTNFARFEALLDSRFARADLQLERQLNERFREFEQRFGAFERRMEKRAGEFEQRMEQRFGVFEERFEHRLGTIEQRLHGMETGLPLLREELRRGQLQHLRWIAGLWMTTMAGLFAVLATIIRQG